MKFEIDVALGWTGWFSFTAIREKLAKAGNPPSKEQWVGKGGITSHLGDKGQNDVYMWMGHTYTHDGETVEGITGWRLGAVIRGGEAVPLKDITDAMKFASPDLADEYVRANYGKVTA